MWIFCRHERTRCLHGEEIVQRMSPWKSAVPRQACVDCGKTLHRPLPVICTVTGTPHFIEDGAS